MEPNDLHETIAQQLDNMKPSFLRPGIDVGMAALDDTTLLVRVMPNEPNNDLSHDAQISYDAGRDLYSVTIFRHGESKVFGGVYCDQLGELVFGSEATPFSLPLVRVSSDDGETWETIA